MDCGENSGGAGVVVANSFAVDPTGHFDNAPTAVLSSVLDSGANATWTGKGGTRGGRERER